MGWLTLKDNEMSIGFRKMKAESKWTVVSRGMDIAVMDMGEHQAVAMMPGFELVRNHEILAIADKIREVQGGAKSGQKSPEPLEPTQKGAVPRDIGIPTAVDAQELTPLLDWDQIAQVQAKAQSEATCKQPLQVPDEIEESVCADIRQRRDAGRAKYGQTMERTDLSPEQWDRHLYEELLDAAVYMRKRMQIRTTEQSSVDASDMLRDELIRIKACSGVTDEIVGICERGIRGVDREIPVVADLVLVTRERNKFESELLQRRWIPVSERLPEVDQEVLVCDVDGRVTIDRQILGHNPNGWDAGDYYTHWQPLPEPPVEGGAQTRGNQGPGSQSAYSHNECLVTALEEIGGPGRINRGAIARQALERYSRAIGAAVDDPAQMDFLKPPVEKGGEG